MKEPRDGAFLNGREILRRKNGHPLLFTDWTWQLCPPGSDRCTSLTFWSGPEPAASTPRQMTIHTNNDVR